MNEFPTIEPSGEARRAGADRTMADILKNFISKCEEGRYVGTTKRFAEALKRLKEDSEDIRLAHIRLHDYCDQLSAWAHADVTEPNEIQRGVVRAIEDSTDLETVLTSITPPTLEQIKRGIDDLYENLRKYS